MDNKKARIVSLLPSSTEIVAALGLRDQLAGRSHECDFPPGIDSLPACTAPKFDADGQSYEINQRVKALLQEGLSVYRVNGNRLAALNPDFIITQDHCEVCAASVSEVKEATREILGNDVEIISVSPTNLNEVFDSIRQIAAALNRRQAGKQLVETMQADFYEIKQQTSDFNSKKLLCIEWLDPLMTAGNWMPELAEIAGSEALLAKKGIHSPWIDWLKMVAADPEVICIMPCGYTIEQTLAEMDTLTAKKGWGNLKAVQNNRVFIADGHHYFNRPGPRLVDSARILAEMMHSELEPTFKSRGWVDFLRSRNPYK